MKRLITVLIFILTITSVTSAQWVQNFAIGGSINALINSGNYIFMGTSGFGVYMSSNNGANWVQVNSGLTSLSIKSFAINSSYLFAGTSNGMVFRTSNLGNNWTLVNSGLPSNEITALAVLNADVFATCTGGVFKSTNNGTSWTPIGLTSYMVVSLLVTQSYMIAGTALNGVYLSTNNGNSWSMVASGLSNKWVRTFAVSGQYIYAGTNGSGVYLSTNNAITWTAINNGINDTNGGKNVMSLYANGNAVLAGMFENGVFASGNNGQSWTRQIQGMQNQGFIPTVYSLTVNNNYAFAGGCIPIGCYLWKRPYTEIIGVSNITAEIPSTFKVYQNYPNPFNPTTTIKFDVPKSTEVKLIIYDIQGRKLSTLVNEKLLPGTYESNWDASEYPSGIYIYELYSYYSRDSKKMILIK